ncbi:hypothetical protein NQF86_02885 [Bombella sp. TMW 2.2543]|uniref:Uncharacterized protein n=1 Tax=Bombella pluederhausensis TaxID=2967336 RepID=A0ABT3WFI5_9PROT|nr:hypothetical protein [Bombella pluederhausensis]MCX5617618.1 hypothetical protein [Bombella pluederhausensis]
MKRSVFTIAILVILSHAHAQDVPFDERTDDYYKSRNAAQFESILSDWGALLTILRLPLKQLIFIHLLHVDVS